MNPRCRVHASMYMKLTNIPGPPLVECSPYSPCLLGFEGHGGNRTPSIRGIVVHDHNVDLLREASVEVHSKAIEDENENRRKAIYTKWKKLLVGALTKDRLEREYG